MEEDSFKTPDDCHNCEWFNLCRNGCKRYRYKEEKYYFCKVDKEFFEYSFIRIRGVTDNLKENHLRRQSYE
ncbi:hypothetical protein [Petrotoga sp. 9PW.55.5.1]|uniref:hypothetical protein n=1 Tax=Petrotoga sp. 9PW.55.5.1 TaxID=1308979 RepID=UPI0011BD149B|nr:hypothetical protein [Petrotoga sp. 9PW.55.5.1]